MNFPVFFVIFRHFLFSLPLMENFSTNILCNFTKFICTYSVSLPCCFRFPRFAVTVAD